MRETRWTAIRVTMGFMLLASAGLGSSAVVDADDLQAGISLYKQGKYAEAAAQLANAPGADAKAYLAASLAKQKKYDEAIDRMGAAIKARADLAHAYYWRGQAYYKKKQPDRMVSDFETFLKLAPKAPEANSVKQLLAGLR